MRAVLLGDKIIAVTIFLCRTMFLSQARDNGYVYAHDLYRKINPVS